MALYEFRCECGTLIERSYPMGAAPSTLATECCEGPARRVFTAPRLGRTNDPAYRAIDATKRSAHEPAVVRSTPPSGRRAPVSTDPRHRRLPRP